MLPHSTQPESGIPGLGKLSWGSHICQWYTSRQELVSSLVPYFQAGLLNNERCIWITADPYGPADAKADLIAVTPGFSGAMEEQIEIRHYNDWYQKHRKSNLENVVDYWLTEEARALSDGYQGLRIAGNTSFVRPDDWDDFFVYERTVDTAFRKHRVIALCNYSLMKTDATHIFEAVKSHQHTIYRQGSDWTLLGVRPRNS